MVRGPVSQEYTVRYTRRQGSNDWMASTRRHRDPVDGGIETISEPEEDEGSGGNRVAFVVAIRSEPRHYGPQAFVRPSVWGPMRDEARRRADAKLKASHPDAVIHHDDDEDA